MGIGTRGKRVWLLIDHARCGGIDHKVYTAGHQRCHVSYKRRARRSKLGHGGKTAAENGQGNKTSRFPTGQHGYRREACGDLPLPSPLNSPFWSLASHLLGSLLPAGWHYVLPSRTDYADTNWPYHYCCFRDTFPSHPNCSLRIGNGCTRAAEGTALQAGVDLLHALFTIQSSSHPGCEHCLD